MRTRLAALAAALVATFAVLTGCGSGNDYAVPDRSSGWTDGYGHCYVANGDYQMLAWLQANGLCAYGWNAMPAPGWWMDRYAPYLASDSFVNTVVPRQQRNTYITVIHHYEDAHQGGIKSQQAAYQRQQAVNVAKQQASQKVYKDSNTGDSKSTKVTKVSTYTSTKTYRSGR